MKRNHHENMPQPPPDGAGADALAALADATTASTHGAVDEVLAEWDAGATVRRRPRRTLIGGEEAGQYFFTPELIPHVQHPLIAALGSEARHRLALEHFYTYSDFTEQLEDQSVVAAGMDILHGDLGFQLPEAFSAGARALIADEAWHSLFTYDQGIQVARATGIRPNQGGTPAYLVGFNAIQEGLEPAYRPLSRLLFAVVSETLITGTLTQVPKDDRVARVVREAFNDHAADERRHHVFFAGLFREVWPRLSRRQQAVLGPLLPRFIRFFLDPDLSAARRALGVLSLETQVIDQVITESYPAAQLARAGRSNAKRTLRLFQETGVLDLAPAREAFDEQGLLG